MNLHDILVEAGIIVLDARVNPRPGAYAPVGIMWHHTGGAPTGDLPTLPILQHGRTGLAGPLAQDGIGREGTVASVSDARANGSGRGSSETLDRVRADEPPTGKPGPDDTDCNAFYINLEIENTGSQPYPDIQLAAVVAVSAAYCKHFGWTANRCVGHKESTHRKNDASFDCFAMRARVAAALNPAPTPPEVPDIMLPALLVPADNNGKPLPNRPVVCVDSNDTWRYVTSPAEREQLELVCGEPINDRNDFLLQFFTKSRKEVPR